MGGLFLYVALAIGAVLGGGAMVGIEKFFVQPSVVAKAVQAEAERCAGKINLMRAQSAEATLAQFEAATQAELGIGPTPVDRGELQLMCDEDRACRERVK